MKKISSKNSLARFAIISMAILYLCIPLSKSFSEVFHKISHSLSQTTSHHHHDSDSLKDHQHEGISFFDALFSSEKEDSQAHKITSEIIFDKHFSETSFSLNLIEIKNTKLIFGYKYINYFVILSCESPPPKYYFS